MDDFRIDCEGVWTGYRALLGRLPDGTYSLNFCCDEWAEEGYHRVKNVYHFEPPESSTHPEGGRVPPMLVLSVRDMEELGRTIRLLGF